MSSEGGATLPAIIIIVVRVEANDNRGGSVLPLGGEGVGW